jgi:hypothetical protein
MNRLKQNYSALLCGLVTVARWWGLLALTLACLAPGSASASLVEDASDCLERSDLVCAQKIRDQLRRGNTGSIAALEVEATVAFHEGRYTEALQALDALKARGDDVETDNPGTPYRATAEAADGLISAEAPGVRVRYSPGVDAILAEEAVSTLARSRTVYGELLGGAPPQDLVLDIFPTARRFTLASGLPPESVETTGVVALSKWTRLLLTSPRALARGYGWKDTAAHEYIHLVVAWRTGNRAPVWLQEGLAKFLEGFWRGQTDGGLPAHHQSLLAEAVRTGKFVPFEKFARSMAYLDSGEEAALAFAQVSTMVQFLVVKSGAEALPGVLDRVRDGAQAEAAVAEAAGYPNFEAFRQGWVEWLRTLPLVQQHLAALPMVLEGGGDEFAEDPLLSGRADLARYTRLGDLLRKSGRPKAALIEYEKAEDPKGPPSPLLMARRADCYLALGDVQKALSIVDEGRRLYPEFTLIQVTRGRLLDQLGRTSEAIEAWQAAHDLNPYDPAVQAALVRDYRATGDLERAARHERFAQILASGGADPGPSAPR